jgi:hypothetical protein
MARNPDNLYASASIPTTKTEVISAEANTKRIIRKATFTNNSGGALTLDIYIDPTGSAEAQIADTKSLADQETWSCPDLEGHVLQASGTIDLGSSGAGIDCIISGIKVT